MTVIQGDLSFCCLAVEASGAINCEEHVKLEMEIFHEKRLKMKILREIAPR